MADAPEIDGREWLAGFSAALGVEPPSDRDIDLLLDLAGVAAHDSERIAAPIACWLIGRAGLDAATALAEAQRFASSRRS